MHGVTSAMLCVRSTVTDIPPAHQVPVNDLRPEMLLEGMVILANARICNVRASCLFRSFLCL